MNETPVEAPKKIRYPKGVTEEQVSAWKAQFPTLSIRMTTIGTKRVVIRPYLRQEIVDQVIKIKDDVLNNCCLHVDGGVAALTTSEKSGLLDLIELASGAPEFKVNAVLTSEDLEGEMLTDLKTRNAEAANAVINSITQHGAALVFATQSKFQNLNGLWVFSPVGQDDDMPAEDVNKVVAYVLAKKLMFPGPILDPGTLLAGHYAEMAEAISGLLGYAPTSDIIEL